MLSERDAERIVAERAFECGPPGFVGAAVERLLDRPGLPVESVEQLRLRPRLRHGYVTARSPRVVVVSGPPSPGLDICLDRMAEDLPLADFAALPVAADAAGAAAGPALSAGIRVSLEAGLDGGGVLGLRRRWALADTLAPVLAAAFANAPLDRGRPSGWRSLRQARRVLPGLGNPRASWTAYAMDTPGPTGRTLREWTRSAHGPTLADLERHLDALHPPVAARGHLQLDVADSQPGDGWRVVVAVVTTLMDDPVAATAAEAATSHFAYQPDAWERAARDALTDPALAVAARECFLAAYAALARQGASRDLRDAVADFTERYVLRGRCPADDVLERAAAQA